MKSVFSSKTLLITNFILLFASCGKKDSAVKSEPLLPPTPVPTLTPKGGDSVAVPTPTPTPIPPKNFWIGYDNSFTLQKYDPVGTLLAQCDLKSAPFLAGLSSGGVTALANLNETNFLALIDPGAKDERIVLVDVSSAVCRVTPWFETAPGFTNIDSNRIIPFSTKDYYRIFASRKDGIDRFTYINGGSVASRAAGPNDSPFVPKSPLGKDTCVAGEITSIIGINDSKSSSPKLLALSTGEGSTRLNVISNLMGGQSGNPWCWQSYDYSSEKEPTTKADKPIYALNIVKKEKQGIYILFQNPDSGGKLVSYVWQSGEDIPAPLQKGKLLSQDADDLGYMPKTMTALNSDEILIANGRSLVIIDSDKGQLIRPLESVMFGEHVSALLTEP